MEIHFKNAPTKEISRKDSSALSDKAIRKITTLKRFLGTHEQDAQVYVELGKVSAAHQQGELWRAHIALEVNGKSYNAEARGEEPDLAIDHVIFEIRSEVQKAKKRERSMLHKGGAALKAFMRGFSPQ